MIIAEKRRKARRRQLRMYEKKRKNMAICDVEHCDDNELHRDRILKALEMMPDEDELCDLAELFKVFGDSTRIRILYALFDNEICVCDLAETLSMTQSAISHQLKVLKDNNLVGSRREGKTIYYFLADDHVRLIVGQGYAHLTEEREKKK